MRAAGLALPSSMPKSVKELVEAANAVVPRVTPEQAQQMIADGALVVDVRDAPEVEQSGKVAGAVHIPRGRRARSALGPGAQGDGLRRGVQPRRFRRLGEKRRGHRQALTSPDKP